VDFVSWRCIMPFKRSNRSGAKGFPGTRRLLACAFMALGAVPASAAYGDTREIPGLCPVPAGWVVTAVRHKAGMWAVPPSPEALRATQTLVIKDLSDAPLGARETVMDAHNLPHGWSVVDIVNARPNSSAHAGGFIIERLS